MAIYHLSIGFISRSTGRSAVQNVAYITGDNLHESRRNLDANYKNRASDIAYTTTLIPDHVDDSFAHISVWDKIESFEDVYAKVRFPNGELAREKYMNSAQTAMTVIAALPNELTLDTSKELIEDFLNERFVSRGLIATYAIHKNNGNPHAHFLISRRSVNEKGEFSWFKDREICMKRELLKTRSLWAEKANFYLERDGHEMRITEKSFLDLGVNLIPTKHHGWYADKLKNEGKTSRIIVENEHVFDQNQHNIELNPTIILDEITSKQATFSQNHLLKAIQKRIGDDINRIQVVFEKCLEAAIPVGIHVDKIIRYTSPAYQKTEETALALLSEVKEQTFHEDIAHETIEKTLSNHYPYLMEEQKDAVFGLLKNNALSVLIGRAGAGKTTTLRAVSDLYKQAGFSVFGVSLSALASENLGVEADIKASTLHSLLYKLDTYKQAQERFLAFDAVMEEGLFKQRDWYKHLKRYEADQLTDKSVIIVDEAGMVGTKQWGNLLEHAKKAKAKIIAVGDDNQFKAIDAGDFLRCIKDEAKDQLFNLKEIRRQKEDWMKQATQAFATLDVQDGLTAYYKKGLVHETDQRNIETDIAKDYVGFIQSGKDVAVLGYTHAQNKRLNAEIRAHLIRKNLIEEDVLFHVHDQSFSKNDKIVFLKNDKRKISITNEWGEKINGAFIKNGTTGHVVSADKDGNVCVQLSDKSLAHFNIKTYHHLDYGYAITVHKSQGKTVDVTLLVAAKQMDAKAIYVGLTRHRDVAHLYYTKEDFKSFNHLKIAFLKFDDKDLIKDYTILPHHEAAYQRVQDYKMCVMDAAALLSNQADFDLKTYKEIKNEQITLGKEILKDFEAHQHFIHQSGLTQEMLKISVGEKQRPLSFMEEQVKLRIELYGETAQAARDLWRDLKNKDLNQHKTDYEKFKELQTDRNALAHEILNDEKRHAPFLKDLQKNYGMNKKTLYKHSESFKKDVAAVQKEIPSVDSKINSLNPKTVENKHPVLKETQSIERQNHSFKAFDKSTHDIVNELNASIKDIAHHFLGKPTNRSSREWRYGKKGSLSIKVAGARQGLYANFETGESGNVIKFIADQMGIDKKEAFKWGEQYVRGQRPGIKKTHIPQKSVKDQQYVPVFPIPVPYPDLKTEKQLSYMLKGRHEVAKFEYKDADGKTLGYVVRLEDKEGNKITPTLTYCRKMLDLNSSATSYSSLNLNSNQSSSTPEHSWQFKGFGEDRPLYGLDVLKQKASAPVLIVEGEKTCEAAREIFKDHAVITWNGGCGSVHKSDWSVLQGRDVTIFPDHDKAGENAAHKISDILKDHAVQSLSIVNLPATLPHKWDLADPLPHDMHYPDLMNHKTTIVEKKPEIERISEKTLQQFAQKLNVKRHDKDHDIEKNIINTLYHFYKNDKSDESTAHHIAKAVLVGVHMHDVLSQQNSENLKNPSFIKEAYKIGLCVFYKFDEGGAQHAYNQSKKLYKDGVINTFIKENLNWDELENAFKKQGIDKDIVDRAKKREQIKNITKEDIEKVAKALSTSLTKNIEKLEIALVNVLYHSYKNESPHVPSIDLLVKAVSIALHVSKHQQNLSQKDIFYEKTFEEAYKIGLCSYHAFDHAGSFKKAYHYAASLSKHQKIDHHLEHDFSKNHHYKDISMQSHIQQIHNDLKFHECDINLIKIMQHQQNIHDIQKHQPSHELGL